MMMMTTTTTTTMMMMMMMNASHTNTLQRVTIQMIKQHTRRLTAS
jgi:hypothetical protein